MPIAISGRTFFNEKASSMSDTRRTRFKSVGRTELAAYIVGAAYKVIRMTRLPTALAGPGHR